MDVSLSPFLSNNQLKKHLQTMSCSQRDAPICEAPPSPVPPSATCSYGHGNLASEARNHLTTRMGCSCRCPFGGRPCVSVQPHHRLLAAGPTTRFSMNRPSEQHLPPQHRGLRRITSTCALETLLKISNVRKQRTVIPLRQDRRLAWRCSCQERQCAIG